MITLVTFEIYVHTGLGRAGAWKMGMTDRAAALHTDYQKDLQKFVYSRKSTIEENGGDEEDGNEGIVSSEQMSLGMY